MELVRHEAWDSPTLKDYKDALLENIFINPKVPEEIRKQIKLVERLMLHTYYEYYFIDIALVQAIFIFEKALKVRYEELQNAPGPNLQTLIKWFHERHYFEERNYEAIDKLRSIRNGKVHDAREESGGIGYLKVVYTVFDLINDLYEDTALRKQRFSETDLIQGKFDSICNAGAIFKINDKRLIIYQTKVEFLNNKTAQGILHLRVRPIYKPHDSLIYSGDYPPSIDLAVTDWELKESVLQCKLLSDKSEIIFSKIEDEVNAGKFSNWWQHFSKQSNFWLNMFEISLNQMFLRHLREFHSQNLESV